MVLTVIQYLPFNKKSEYKTELSKKTESENGCEENGSEDPDTREKKEKDEFLADFTRFQLEDSVITFSIANTSNSSYLSALLKKTTPPPELA